MELRSDFQQRAVVIAGEEKWTASPMPGVDRLMLDRIGGEKARATSVVRYAPGSVFPEHVHDEGEEFLVLEGIFSDEHGDFGPGTYVRNPPGSSHSPGSEPGCTIFVKLRQFDPEDTIHVVIDTTAAAWSPGLVPGLEVLPLHSFSTENVALVRWSAGTVFDRHSHPQGEEIFVIDGVFEDEFGRYPAGSWLRNPPASSHAPFSAEGCLIYVKTGHLPSPG